MAKSAEARNSGKNRPGVFISHCHKDRAFAERLAADLRKHNIDVWFDGWELELGDTLTRRIQSGIQSRQYLAVVLSPDAVESEWVYAEWTAAFVRGIREKRVAVIPLLYRTCKIPLFLDSLVRLDFREDSQYNAQLQALVDRLWGRTKRPETVVNQGPLGEEPLRTYLEGEVRDSEGRHPLSSLSSKAGIRQVYQIRLLLKQPLSTSPETEDQMLDTIGKHLGTEGDILWVSGEPGMGKTWLIHRWRSRLARDTLNGSATGKIPIYVSLGELSNRLLVPGGKLPATLAQAIRSVPDFIVASVCKVLDERLRKGDAVVFLDGRDEIQPQTERTVAEWVAQQQLCYPRALFVITTRPAAHWWQRDMDTTYELLPLDDGQVDNFIHEWFGAARGQLAERITWALRTQPGLATLVRNPMILTMLCMTWERYGAKQTQAPRITGFYEQCANLLLEEWDDVEHGRLARAAPATHSPRRATVAEKLDVLTQVAVRSFPKTTIGFDTLCSVARGALPSDFAPEDVIQDIEVNSGLLRCSDTTLAGPARRYEFSHPTFREYFAARDDACASKGQPCDTLGAHFWDPQWENRIALVIDLRPEWRVALVSAALKYLPADIGRVARVSSVTPTDRFVILVDMCVDNWSGRMNIVRMVRPLIATGITSLITTSGADGNIDTSWFKAFPDEKIRREVALHFVKKLEITGVEYLSIATNLEFTLWGAEDRELYVRQLNLFTQGNRWSQEYHELYGKRAEFAATTISEQMNRYHVQVTAMTAEPLLLWEMEKQLAKIGVPYSIVNPYCDENTGDFARYLGVMRNEKTPFEELVAWEKKAADPE